MRAENTTDLPMPDSSTKYTQIAWGSFWIRAGVIGLSMVGAFMVGTYQSSLNTPPTFVTISVAGVIASQAKAIDTEMLQNNTILSEAQIQERVEKYTHKIAATLKEYSKKNRVIDFEKGAIVSQDEGIKDITDAFIEAINE